MYRRRYAMLIAISLALVTKPVNSQVIIQSEPGSDRPGTILSIIPGGAEDPLRWELDGGVLFDNIEEWKIYKFGETCIAETQSVEGTDDYLYVGYGSSGSIRSIGASQYDLNLRYNLFEGTKIEISIDNAETVADRAKFIYRVLDTLPGLIPSVLITGDPIPLPENYSFPNLSEGYEAIGRSKISMRSSRIIEDSIWNSFRSGNEMTVSMSVPSENGKTILATGTFSLRGSSATYWALARCSQEP